MDRAAAAEALQLMAKPPPPSLGGLLRGLRARRGWTLKQMSDLTGIPVSTLSKVEHDRLTLTYDKLLQLSQRLNMRMSELFAEEDAAQEPTAVNGRRSIGSLEGAVEVSTPNYEYHYLCPELRRKRMIPVVARIRARSLEEFGELVRQAFSGSAQCGPRWLASWNLAAAPARSPWRAMAKPQE